MCFCLPLYGLHSHLECPIPQWRGNGICEDANNIAACNFDGGDCCGPNVNKQYCEECKCYNMTENHKACENPLWSGNGFCDDENNNDKCNFDGGDCCLDVVDKHYCSKCVCHENTYPQDGKMSKVPKQLKTHCKSSVYFKSDYQKMYCAIPQKSKGNVHFQDAKEVCRYE